MILFGEAMRDRDLTTASIDICLRCSISFNYPASYHHQLLPLPLFSNPSILQNEIYLCKKQGTCLAPVLRIINDSEH